MGRRYTEPTSYRDKQCPICGYYFTARGLNGHIRFYHEGYEEQEKERLNRKLWIKALYLAKKGYKEVEYAFPLLGDKSNLSLRELQEIEDGFNMLDTPK